MSDLTIPGVSSKYNSAETIKALVEAERIRLVRMENDRDVFKQQKTVWLKLNRHLAEVRTQAKGLYGFENPFEEKIAVSSDQAILSATANRTAVEEKRTFEVRQIAMSDRFVSRSLSQDFTVEKGLYRFQVGDEEVKLSFSGGSLKDFARAINRKAGDLLKATIVEDTKDTRVFVIEALKTGSKNQLSLHGQALDFGERAGIIERSPGASRDIALNMVSVQPWGTPLDKDAFAIAEGVLTLNSGGELKLPMNPAVRLNKNMVLSLEIRTSVLPEQAPEAIDKPVGPLLPDVGAIEFEGIRVESARSLPILPDWTPPEQPQRVDDLQVLFASGQGIVTELPQIKDSQDFATVTIAADALPEQLESLLLRNRNTHRIVEIRNIKLFDQTARGEYRPVNPLSTAQDTRLIMDGIEVVRETNEIDDLVPGVNLTLHSASEKTVQLDVDKDIETIKNNLIRFVGTYNKLLTQLDILTRRDEAVIEDAQFLDDDEKDQAREELGLFMGNVTLMQLKTRLQRTMMNAYRTDGGQEMSLLAQMGISTSAGGSTGVLDKSRLRGYLQMDEAKLDEAVARHVLWIKQIFGNDTDKDLIVDSGVAYTVDRDLQAYVEPGGVLPSRVATIDISIDRKNKEIDDYNEHLEDYERDLRRKYGIMEGALDTLEKSSQQIENFNRRTDR